MGPVNNLASHCGSYAHGGSRRHHSRHRFRGCYRLPRCSPDSIVPAVPSSTGVADVFSSQMDGTVQAITAVALRLGPPLRAGLVKFINFSQCLVSKVVWSLQTLGCIVFSKIRAPVSLGPWASQSLIGTGCGSSGLRISRKAELLC